MGKLYLLFEAASGYAIFRVVEAEDVASGTTAVQSSWGDFHRFASIVKLRAFEPYVSADQALEDVSAVSENRVTPFLLEFVRSYFGSKRCLLGVSEPRFGAALQEQLGKKHVRVVADEHIQELLRNIRQHFEKFLSAEVSSEELSKAQLGLAHALSRSRIQFNPQRNDHAVVQAIHLIDQLDKDINTFGMRVREWYSWHFPELAKLVSDIVLYCRLVCALGMRSEMTTKQEEDVNSLLHGDEELTQRILRAARSSMGTEISLLDIIQIRLFAQRVIQMATYRDHLQGYLGQRLSLIAPSLRALLGDHVAARLIAHAGSLVNLAKYPASTVQILGAEKALFRALKQARGKRLARTPKYGLLFNSTFIAKAKQRAKGRISRYLANKVSLASRIDCFRSDRIGDTFGRKLREQVEERLQFYEKGLRPRRNAAVMTEAMNEALATSAMDDMRGSDIEETPRPAAAGLRADRLENSLLVFGSATDADAEGVPESAAPETPAHDVMMRKRSHDDTSFVDAGDAHLTTLGAQDSSREAIPREAPRKKKKQDKHRAEAVHETV